MGRNRNNKEEDLLKYYESIYYVVYYSVGLPIETPRKKPLKVIDFQGLWSVVAVRTGLTVYLPRAELAALNEAYRRTAWYRAVSGQ